MSLDYQPDPGGIVTDPRFWESSAGYEYWLVGGNADIITAIGTANDGLDGYGWTTTALSVTEGSGGDVFSSADRDPTLISFGAAADAMVSPRIFGSYAHALQAARFLGGFPRKLCLEAVAAFTTNSANEPGSFIGFSAPAVTDITAAGGAAGIYSNSANFVCAGDVGTDTGAAVDTALHTWRIEVGTSTTEWFIDGATQGTFTTEADIWPTCFKTISTTTNRISLIQARVYYEL